MEEAASPFSSEFGHFAPGALLLLSIMCAAQGVLPGWQFSCVPGSFLPLKTSSSSFTAQRFSTRFVSIISCVCAPHELPDWKTCFSKDMSSHTAQNRQKDDQSRDQLSITQRAVNFCLRYSIASHATSCSLAPYFSLILSVTCVSTESKCWVLYGNIPSQRLKMMDKQTLQWHDYTKGRFPACATATAISPVERGAAQAAAPTVTAHLQSSCWQQLAEGARWAPCSVMGKAGAACFRCVFVFMNLLFGIRLLVCEELHYPVTTLPRNQRKNQWPLSSPKC